MKLQVELYAIQDAIKKVVKVVAKKSKAHSVLERVKLTAATGEGVTLEATNLSTSIKVTVPASVLDPGTVLLNQDTLKLITQSKSAGIVTITDTEITLGKSLIKYYGLDEDEYPTMEYDLGTFGFTVTQKELLEMLSVKYAAAVDESRPVFNSVLIDKNHVVATDTHRLAQKRIPVDNKLEKSVLVPIEAVKLLCGYLKPKSGEKVTCSVSGTAVSFSFGNVVLVSRKIDGTYPRWTAVIPRDFATTLKVDVVNVVAELKGLQTIAKSCRTMILEAEDETLYVTIGEFENAVKVEFKAVITGDKLARMGVDYFFFCELLTAHGDGFIEIKFGTPFSPIYLNGDILLPVRVGN